MTLLDGQMGLFDTPPPRPARPARPTQAQAEAARDAGMAQSAATAGADWAAQATDLLRQFLVAHEFFHVDAYWPWAMDRGLDVGPSPRAFGQVVRGAAKHGWMTRTDIALPSVRSRMSPKPVWRSGLYRGPLAHTYRGVSIP